MYIFQQHKYVDKQYIVLYEDIVYTVFNPHYLIEKCRNMQEGFLEPEVAAWRWWRALDGLQMDNCLDLTFIDNAVHFL